MIRVIYQWDIPLSCQERFKKAWAETTQLIAREVPGARGSCLFQNYNNPNLCITIARWESLADWQRFWNNEKPNYMFHLHEIAKRINTEVFIEVEDFTR